MSKHPSDTDRAPSVRRRRKKLDRTPAELLDTGARTVLDTKEAAERLDVSERTLEAWRLRGGGPRFVKIGRLARYRLRDLEAWLDSQARSSTSEESVRASA